jgi:hypothetical protein
MRLWGVAQGLQRRLGSRQEWKTRKLSRCACLDSWHLAYKRKGVEVVSAMIRKVQFLPSMPSRRGAFGTLRNKNHGR